MMQDANSLLQQAKPSIMINVEVAQALLEATQKKLKVAKS